MGKYLEKIYQNNNNQIYVSHNNYIHLETNYLYIYRDESNEINEIVSEDFPYMEFSTFKGYLFCKHEKDIPILPTSFLNIFKTNIKNMNNKFTDKSQDIIIKLTGFRNCSPKINKNIYFGYSYSNFMKLTNEDVLKMYKEFYKSQSIKNITEWFEYIRKKCPYDIKYKIKISDDDFNKKLTENDIMVEYDIRHKDEISLIKKVENLFDDNDSMIIILNDFHNTLEKIAKLVSDRKDITAYKGKNKLAIKYSDLLKLNLDWTIENFY